MKNQVFKYTLKLNDELVGYFVSIDSASAYIKCVEEEVDFGNVDGSDIERWEIERWEIERWEAELPSGEWYEFGLVDGVVLGAVPQSEHCSIDLGFILAGCQEGKDFDSENVLL